MLDDAILIWKLRSGSKEALRLIYEQHARYLLTLAAGLLGCPSRAEDVVQDVFIRLVQTPSALKRPGNLKAWLATFAGDRDGAMAALSQAIDHDMSYEKGLELDLILARWKDDPLFREQLLRMRQIAEERRAELEAYEREAGHAGTEAGA